jgi:peptidoglycan hydrolase-like protein with peptidoglycan-binding domain
MQKVLDGIGYQQGGAATSTSQAVMKFQADNQLKADGKIGAKTWEKVRQLWNAKKPKA